MPFSPVRIFIGFEPIWQDSITDRGLKVLKAVKQPKQRNKPLRKMYFVFHYEGAQVCDSRLMQVDKKGFDKNTGTLCYTSDVKPQTSRQADCHNTDKVMVISSGGKKREKTDMQTLKPP